jgi:hypothetical protein
MREIKEHGLFRSGPMKVKGITQAQSVTILGLTGSNAARKTETQQQ